MCITSYSFIQSHGVANCPKRALHLPRGIGMGEPYLGDEVEAAPHHGVRPDPRVLHDAQNLLPAPIPEPVSCVWMK